jgi:hypothetical protein
VALCAVNTANSVRVANSMATAPAAVKPFATCALIVKRPGSAAAIHAHAQLRNAVMAAAPPVNRRNAEHRGIEELVLTSERIGSG